MLEFGAIPVSFANPTVSIGTTAVAGMALTPMRSDGAPALSQAIVMTGSNAWSNLHTFNGGETDNSSFTQTTGAVSVTGNAASSMSITGSVTIDAAAAVNLGPTNATSVNLSRSGQGTSMAGSVLENGSTAGGAGVGQRIVKALSGMADNSPVNLAVITVPNQNGGAGFKVTITGTLGDGNSTQTVKYTVAVSRVSGAASVINIGTGAVTSRAATAGTVATVTLENAAVSGANNATQTFQLQARVTRSAGSSTNHWAVAEIECFNPVATGITVA